jgi:hypothetical protein
MFVLQVYLALARATMADQSISISANRLIDKMRLALDTRGGLQQRDQAAQPHKEMLHVVQHDSELQCLLTEIIVMLNGVNYLSGYTDYSASYNLR